MAKEETIQVEGEIIEVLPNTLFKIKLKNGHQILGHPAGKLRMFNIRLFVGDKVKIELSPYDLSRGRIVYRLK